MFQRFAQWVLRDELERLTKNKVELVEELYDKEGQIAILERALDEQKKSSTFGLTVQTSRDLPFTPEEKQWLKENGETPVLPHILDKLLMNVIAGLAKQPQPATQEDAQRLQNIRLAFLLLQSECLDAAGKKTQVDPLTTEVTQK